MALSDPLDILLAHDTWATNLILQACKPLSTEQFAREFPIGPGSLHKTLVHLLGAMLRWGDALAGRRMRAPLLAADYPTVASLEALLAEASALLAAQARAKPLSDLTQREIAGQIKRFTRGGALTHVLTHGTYHRAQCVNMLRQLGVSPVPDPTIMPWMMTVDPVV